MEIKVKVDVNIGLNEDAKSFLMGLIEVVDSLPKQPVTETKVVDAVGSSPQAAAPQQTPIRAPGEMAIDPDARIVKPITEPKRRGRKKKGYAVEETEHQGQAYIAQPASAPVEHTYEHEDSDLLSAAPEPAPMPIPKPRPEPQPAVAESVIPSGAGMGDTTFRQEVSKIYMGVTGDAKAQVAKNLSDLLSKHNAATITQVPQEQRAKFLDVFRFVVKELA